MNFDEPPLQIIHKNLQPDPDPGNRKLVRVIKRNVLGDELIMQYDSKEDLLYVKKSDFKQLCDKLGTTLEATVPKLDPTIILY